MIKLEFLLSLITLIYLLGYTFFPDRIRVDKYTLSLIAFLFLLSILPSLSSGSISYLFSFKRSLKAAKKAIKKVTGKDGGESDKIKPDKRGAFFTTAHIKEKIRWELAKIQTAKLPKEERIEPSDPLRLSLHLKYKKIIAWQLAEAIQKVTNLCDVVDYDSKLTPEEVQQLVSVSIPLLETLSKD